MAAEQLGEVKRAGGWRGSPNSLAALDRHRPTFADHRKCLRCRSPAVRGQDHCRMHLGRWSPLSAAGGRGESRILARFERAGLLPLELIAMPVWRDLAGLPTSKRAPARLALVLAWDKRQVEPLHWAKVQRLALDLGAQPLEGRQHMAWWYENQ